MTPADAALRFGLSRCPAAIVARLDQAGGRIVDAGTLQEALEAATGNRSTMDTVASHIKRARRGIAGAGRIVTHYGLGYRIEWIEGGPT